MKLTFKKALNIAYGERITDFSKMIKRVKELTETKYNEERIENKLLDLIFDNRELSLSCYDNQTLIYRADIANNRIFYINLTDEEIKDKPKYTGNHNSMLFCLAPELRVIRTFNSQGSQNYCFLNTMKI